MNDASVMQPGVQTAEAERTVRVDLAACYRLIAHYGMTDLIYTHISARVPGTHDQFLINPFGLLFEQITASSLVKIGCDGNAIDDSPYTVNNAGFVIHSAIHPHARRWRASCTRTRARAWPCPAWKMACCRSHRRRSSFPARSPITTTKAPPSISTNGSGSLAISARGTR